MFSPNPMAKKKTILTKGSRFNQDSTELAPFAEHIVRPLQGNCCIGALPQRPAQGEAGDDAQQTLAIGRDFLGNADRAINITRKW
jgi:hypothetical protein